MAVATLATGCVPSAPPASSVVLIVVDTLRSDHLSQYGYARETSTALEEFCTQATRFRHCRAPASWTTPSTGSLLTGLSPGRHGAVFRGAALPEEATTLAEHLRAAGWTTLGLSYNHNLTATSRFDQGFEFYEGTEGDSGVYPDIATMREKVRYLVRTAPEPFLLYLQPMNVHGPYRTPAAHRADLLGHPPDPLFEYGRSHMKAVMKKGELERRAEVSEAYRDSHRDQYDTAIRYTMDQLALVLQDLRDLGRYDDSLIILTADHGEELFDHQGFGHGYTLHEEMLRVPLWIKMPGQRRGAVVERRVALVDLLPTVLETLALPVPADGDGRSLTPLLQEGDDPSLDERPFYFETRWPDRIEGDGILAWPWKLIHVERDYAGREDTLALYDLERDPEEQVDQAARQPEVVDRLRRRLAAWRESQAPVGPAEDVSQLLDAATLEALGYGK